MESRIEKQATLTNVMTVGLLQEKEMPKYRLPSKKILNKFNRFHKAGVKDASLGLNRVMMSDEDIYNSTEPRLVWDLRVQQDDPTSDWRRDEEIDVTHNARFNAVPTGWEDELPSRGDSDNTSSVHSYDAYATYVVREPSSVPVPEIANQDIASSSLADHLSGLGLDSDAVAALVTSYYLSEVKPSGELFYATGSDSDEDKDAAI